jgi:hypothetical protein
MKTKNDWRYENTPHMGLSNNCRKKGRHTFSLVGFAVEMPDDGMPIINFNHLFEI